MENTKRYQPVSDANFQINPLSRIQCSDSHFRNQGLHCASRGLGRSISGVDEAGSTAAGRVAFGRHIFAGLDGGLPALVAAAPHHRWTRTFHLQLPNWVAKSITKVACWVVPKTTGTPNSNLAHSHLCLASFSWRLRLSAASSRKLTQPASCISQLAVPLSLVLCSPEIEITCDLLHLLPEKARLVLSSCACSCRYPSYLLH